MFFDKKFSKLLDSYYLEPGFYLSITNIVEVMTIISQERHNQSESCITVEVSRRLQKKNRFTLQMNNLVFQAAAHFFSQHSH